MVGINKAPGKQSFVETTKSHSDLYNAIDTNVSCYLSCTKQCKRAFNCAVYCAKPAFQCSTQCAK